MFSPCTSNSFLCFVYNDDSLTKKNIFPGHLEKVHCSSFGWYVQVNCRYHKIVRHEGLTCLVFWMPKNAGNLGAFWMFQSKWENLLCLLTFKYDHNFCMTGLWRESRKSLTFSSGEHLHDTMPLTTAAENSVCEGEYMYQFHLHIWLQYVPLFSLW